MSRAAKLTVITIWYGFTSTIPSGVSATDGR
jgi:hypothetical protein